VPFRAKYAAFDPEIGTNARILINKSYKCNTNIDIMHISESYVDNFVPGNPNRAET